jgi:hypothetical protein
MVVDATIEIQNGKHPWRPCALHKSIEAVHGKGPWSVPHALEVARAVWRLLVFIGVEKYAPIRVIDTAGVVVEQWPKRSVT